MKQIKYGMVSALVCLLLVGCGDRQSGTGTADGYVQYYVNTEGTKLLQDTFTTEATDDTGLVTAMADALENQKEGTYLEPLLPDGVQILSYSLKEGHLTLNLSEDYRTADDAQKVLLRAGLVRSFVQFEGVKDVTFEVNGQTLADSSGNAVGPLTEEDFVEAEGREIDAYQYGTFTLYFADASGKKLVAETQNVYYSSSEPKEREVVELLLKGPLHTELKATLSPDVKILNVTLSDGAVYVNLNDAFLNGTSEISERVVVYSLVNSLLELEGTTKVQISINGETKYMLGDGIDLSKFLTKNTELIGE